MNWIMFQGDLTKYLITANDLVVHELFIENSRQFGASPKIEIQRQNF